MRAIYDNASQAPGNLDSQEAATLEREVFGASSASRSRRASAQARGIDQVERAVFGETPQDAPDAPDAPATADAPTAPATADTLTAPAEPATDEGSGVPEADRLFAPPTPEEAAHVLRELDWGQHIVGTRMAAAKGNSTTYIYSFQEAATFFLDDRAGSMSLGTSGQFAWIDIDRFVAWSRDTVGDAAFADVLEERLAGQEAYNDKIETIRQLLLLRIAQYDPYLHGDDEDDGAAACEAVRMEDESSRGVEDAPVEGKEHSE